MTTVVVTLEELEAIRLKDLVGFDRVKCAAAMGVSRATYQRLLYSVRQKVAKALIEGHSLVFEGGSHQLRERLLECGECGMRWAEASQAESERSEYELPCPQCGSSRKTEIKQCGAANHHGHGCCRNW